METVIKDAWASSHYAMFWTSSYLPSSQTFFGAVEVVEEMEVWTNGPFQKTITSRYDGPIYYEEDAVFALLVRQWHEERGSRLLSRIWSFARPIRELSGWEKRRSRLYWPSLDTKVMIPIIGLPLLRL